MSVFLSALVPTTGLAAWYPLDNNVVGGGIDDESGNNRDLVPEIPGIDHGALALSVINGRSAVVHNANASPWQYTIALTPKTIVAVVDVGGSTFASTAGFITGLDSTNSAPLVGSSGTTKWTNTGLGDTYSKSGTSYADANRQAPFNYFEQIVLNKAAGIAVLDGIQIGRDREDGTRLFIGSWADVMIYTTELTAGQLAGLKLYGDLKFGLWLLNGTTLTYPNPDITGINWARFKAFAKTWGEVTDTWEYEDAGRDFNRRTDNPPKRWEIGYTGLSFAQMEIFDAFNDMVGIDRTFSFTDKWDVAHTGVRIESYNSNHDAHKSWSNTVDITLVKHP